MIKKYKKVFLTAFALICTLSLGSNVRAAKITENFNKKVGDSWDIGNGSPCSSSDNSVVSIAEKTFLFLKTDNTLTCKKAGTAVVSCKADFWHNSKDAEYTVNCTAQTNQTSDPSGNKCYLCNGTNYFYTSSAPCDGALDVGISDSNSCLKLNPTTCRLCNNKYTWTDDPNCTFIGNPANQTDCENKNNASSEYEEIKTENALKVGQHYQIGPSWKGTVLSGPMEGNGHDFVCTGVGTAEIEYTLDNRKIKRIIPCVEATSQTPTPDSSVVEGSTPHSQVTYPVDNDRVSISEYAEKEVTLDPPSRATNTTTGTCEDYIVTEENNDKTGMGVSLPIAKTNYLYYSAKTNCTDNQGQEFVAFCVDPAQWGPKPSDNYLIDTYIDPNDGEFSKGIVYIYKEFLKTGMSLVDRCAAENAIRYLEYDNYDLGGIAGGIAPRLGGSFSADAEAYRKAVGGANKSPLPGGSCATQAWTWYQAAKTASVSDVSEGYGVSNLEIVPDSDYTQDDSGNISGHLLVQTPSGERVNGNITITCPSGVTCTDEGDGRIAISGTLSCGDNKLTAAVAGVNSDSNIKSALLVVNKKDPSRKQRFVLFQTGGSVSTSASFEFDGIKNCSTCQTSVDFACVPEGSYTNPIKLKEGTIDGTGDTDWAACVYNNNDEKGNTFNALKNDYCVVSCTEEWDFRLPGNIQTVSGRNFSFTAQIGAKRTCKLVGDESKNGVVTPVNWKRADGKNGQPGEDNYTSYAKDHDYWADVMTTAYNEYIRSYSVYKALEKYVNDNKNNINIRGPLPDTLVDTCNTGTYPADWSINSEKAKVFKDKIILDLTTSPFKYSKIYVYDKQTITSTDAPTSGALGTIQEISPNIDSETRTDKYQLQGQICQQPAPGNPNLTIPTTCTKNCDNSREKYFAKDNDELYESTLQTWLNKAKTAYDQYTHALDKIEEIYEMYTECTDWENEYTFDPEIRFTYQEESYMDLLLQHQNKNYLINRTELEESRKSGLSLYQIDVAVGTPGADSDGLFSDQVASGGFQWPAPSSTGCKRGFGSPDGNTGKHRGMDISSGCGTEVRAAHSGQVIEIHRGCADGFGDAHASDNCGGGFGNHVFISDGTVITRYAHLHDVNVERGQTVSAGQIIGTVGSSGPSTGCHLHFEVSEGGILRGPAAYIGTNGDSNCSDVVSSLADGVSTEGGLSSTTIPDYNDFYTNGPDFPYIKNGGFGYVGTPDKKTIKEATYGESVVEYKAEETEYRSGVYFYTINPSGRVTTDKNAEGAKPLGYVYPVSLNTPQGDYPYYLNFGYVGMYNDSDRLGRIMGAAESSVLSGSAADYACVYNVCDPTMQDCPPQMCDVVTDGNGNTHYYDKEGNETDKDTHDKQCSSRDKVCTREKDENGNDVFCDVNGNCSSDPSSYLSTCAKDCAGYSLVSYESYTGAEVESSGRLQFLPKVISLNKLFSSGNQSAKAINWQNAKAQAARTEIESNGEKIFANSQYEFNLSPSAMAAIRNYNKEQENNDKGYADFNAHCNEYGSDCQSYFLDNLSSMGVDVVKRDTSFIHDSKGYSYK